jgi:Tfp pilus assembly protein PilF
MRYKISLLVLALLIWQNVQAQEIKDPRLQPIKREDLLQLITKTPVESSTHGRLISRARRSKLLGLAYVQYSNIWKAKPNNAYANYWKGMAAYQYEWQAGYASSSVRITGEQKLRLWEAARSGFQRAVELKPDFASANAAYGAFLFKIPHEEKKGMALMKKAVKLEPKHAGAWRTLGEALINPYRDAYNPKEGEAALLKSAKLDPLFAAPHSALTRLYVETKRYKEAQRELQIYTELVGAKNAAPTIKFFKPDIDKGLYSAKR